VQEEEKRHKEHVERVMARLRQEKDAWFLCRSVRYEGSGSFPRIFSAASGSRASFMMDLNRGPGAILALLEEEFYARKVKNWS
jgi:hypothetical protein